MSDDYDYNDFMPSEIEPEEEILRRSKMKVNNKQGGIMLIQQGDVLIKKVLLVRGKKLNHLTVAKGEATGHHHTITKGDAELYEHEGTLFLKVNSEEATLTHQEHGAAVIPQGEYEIGIVREFDHFSEEAKRVQD